MQKELVVKMIQDAETRREKNRASLVELLKQTDRVALVAQASLSYQSRDRDTPASENDRLHVHIEYLALQAAGVGLAAASPRPVAPETLANDTNSAIELVRAIFEDSVALLDLKSMHSAPPVDVREAVTQDYQHRTRLDSLVVRDRTYPEHHERIIHGCFDALDAECRSLLGFVATDAIQLSLAVTALLAFRLQPRFTKQRDDTQTLLKDIKRARRKGPSGDECVDRLAKLSPKQARQVVADRIYGETFGEARSDACFTPADLGEAAGVDEPAARAFLDAFSFDESDFDDELHRFPYGGQPFSSTPVVKVGADLYFLPVSFTGLLASVRPRMDHLLSRDRAVHSRYLDLRGRFVEEESTRILKKMLPGAASWTGIGWRGSETEGELDGLVACDDLALRIQAKSGRVDGSTRRGAPDRMKSNLKKLIGAASEQHRCLAEALESAAPAALGFEPQVCQALKLPLQIDVTVTLDDVSVWSTETHKLKHVAVVDADRRVPWVVSLSDLMVIGDLLQGAHFVDYLLHRLRLEEHGRVSAYEELDWVGHYLHDRLFFGESFSVGDVVQGTRVVQGIHVLLCTDEIDAWYSSRTGRSFRVVPKPCQDIPPHLKNLLDRLQIQQPRHWLLGSVCLLLGPAACRTTLNDTFVRLASCPNGHKRTDTSVVLDDVCGVTVWADHHSHTQEIASHVPTVVKPKMSDQSIENWVAIIEGFGRELAVVTVPSNALGRVAERVMSPRMSTQ